MGRVQTSLGYQIGYCEAGGGDRPPLILLHGVGSDKSVWRAQLEHFGKERRAIAFDYPGYGDSDAAPEGTTRDDYAAAILSATRALGISRAHVCGLSLGGIVAISICDVAPDECVSLILADSFAVHPDGRSIYERGVAASGDLRAMAEARVDILLAQPADPAVRAEVVETMARIDPAAYCIAAEAVWLANQREKATAVGVPALVIVGKEDLVTPYDLSSELVDLIPDARLQVIERAGHISNLEQPAEFNRIVGEFIADVET